GREGRCGHGDQRVDLGRRACGAARNLVRHAPGMAGTVSGRRLDRGNRGPQRSPADRTGNWPERRPAWFRKWAPGVPVGSAGRWRVDRFVARRDHDAHCYQDDTRSGHFVRPDRREGMMSVTTSAGQRGGFARRVVPWVVVGIAALGFTIASASREAIGAARNRIDVTKAAWFAEGCIERARVAINEALTAHRGVSERESMTPWARLDVTVSQSAVLAGTG